MAAIDTLFATYLYRETLRSKRVGALNAELADACRAIAADDVAGQGWSAENGYRGYTSYASLNDLPWRFPPFAELQTHLETHAIAFAKALDLDLGGRRLKLDSMWINILEPGGVHSGHIHPHSVLSGTYYVDIPEGAGALKLEDPRLPLMMAAPPREKRARAENRTFVYVEPAPGMLLMWESWLRHEVTAHGGEGERVSVSFNFGW